MNKQALMQAGKDWQRPPTQYDFVRITGNVANPCDMREREPDGVVLGIQNDGRMRVLVFSTNASGRQIDWSEVPVAAVTRPLNFSNLRLIRVVDTDGPRMAESAVVVENNGAYEMLVELKPRKTEP